MMMLITNVGRYKDKSNQNLVGTGLGEFHVDFPNIEKNCGEVHGIDSYFLGKKTYIYSL